MIRVHYLEIPAQVIFYLKVGRISWEIKSPQITPRDLNM